MKTFLLLVALAAMGAAVYFYLNPRMVPSPAPATATPPPAVEPATGSGPTPAPQPMPTEPVDDRPLMVILRERARWPMEVTLTRPHPMKFPDGEMTLPVGRKLKMTMLTDDGLLLTTVAEMPVKVPFDATDFLDVLPAQAVPASASPKSAATTPRPFVPRILPDKALAAMKAKFPVRRTAKFARTHSKVFEFEVPHVDAWSYYKGMVQTATAEALPRTLRMIDDRAKQDIDMFSKRTGNRAHAPRTSDEAQARASLDWIERDLKPYLAQLRPLAP